MGEAKCPTITEADAMRFATEVAALVDLIKPILAGHPPEVQSGALADCVAIWLAGSLVPGDPAATQRLRGMLLSDVVATVHRLIEPNAKEMGTWDA